MELGPDMALVYGDTNSTLAGTLAAAQAGIPVGHVEAGMRSFDRSMPEELNRVLCDHASDLLLCSTETAMHNLEAEGAAGERHLVGDVMADVLLAFRGPAPRALHRGRGPRPHAGRVRAGHRSPSGQRGRPRAPVGAGRAADGGAERRGASRCIRARARGWRPAGLLARLEAAVTLTAPLGYLDFIRLAASRPRGAHRLRRGAEGGLPARGARA